MEISEAQDKVDKVIKELGGYWEPLSMMARLTEEIGELARAINIKYGEKKSKDDNDGREIEKEMSDVMFTILAIANSMNIDLSKEFKNKMIKDYERNKEVYKKD